MLSDSTRRALRTAYGFVVALLGIIPTILLLLPDSVRSGTLGGQDLSAILTTIVVWHTFSTKLINALEDAGKIPAWLKAPASDGVNPVPDDAGYAAPGLLVLLLLIILLVWLL